MAPKQATAKDPEAGSNGAYGQRSPSQPLRWQVNGQLNRLVQSSAELDRDRLDALVYAGDV